MKILKFSYQDVNRQWQLNEVDFDNLTMLVGASGVGKTQILQSIMNLKKIATKGESILGAKWQITFDTLKGDRYQWSGEFYPALQSSSLNQDEDSKAEIFAETLVLNGKAIIERKQDEIFFNRQKTVQLSQYESIIHLLQREELIRPAYNAFEKIMYSDQTSSQSGSAGFGFANNDFAGLVDRYKTVTEIQNSKEPINIKLFLIAKTYPNLFAVIKDRYTDIFPQVEDIKIDFVDNLHTSIIKPTIFKEILCIQIKEKGVDTWIEQSKISSGMYRSLIQISEIYLSSEGSVFLIDEFENSLGVNCIHEMTSDILSADRQLQFILTSHHPYIIDNIPLKSWKIVTRDKGVVNTHDADSFNIGKSKHTAFKQLLQLDEYQTGMSS